jgi:hypothetical protein
LLLGSITVGLGQGWTSWQNNMAHTWWVGSRERERYKKWSGQAITTKDTPPLTYFLQLGPTLHCSTTSQKSIQTLNILMD